MSLAVLLLGALIIASSGGCSGDPQDAPQERDVSGDSAGGHGDDIGDSNESPYGALALESIAIWGRANGFGGEGSGPGDFAYPTGIALSPDETELYVFETGNKRIKVMSLTGDTLRSWPCSVIDGVTGGSGIAVAADGTVIVADDVIHGVVSYAPDGTVRDSWGLVGVGPFTDYPGHDHDLIVASDSTIVVTEGGLGQIQVFEPDGTFVRSIGERGREKGQFRGGPLGVAEVDHRFYVTDFEPGGHPLGHRVMIFDRLGNYVGVMPPLVGEEYPALGSFMAEWDGWLFLAASVPSPDPTVVLAQAPGFDRVTHRTMLANGKLPGAVGFVVDVAIDRSGRWYVTEILNHRVQVFQATLTTTR